jgi:hypothetical protein
VNWLSLSSYNSTGPSLLGSDVRGSCAGRSGHCCDHCSNSSGRLGLRRSDLVSIHFTRRSFLGPRRHDLANYWAHGPFVRSFILLVDPGDISPPQRLLQKIKESLHEVISTVYSPHATSYALLLPFLKCKQCRLADGENCGHQWREPFFETSMNGAICCISLKIKCGGERVF